MNDSSNTQLELEARQLLASIRNQARRAVYEEADDSRYFEAARIADEGIRQRILVERAILRRVARDLITAGFTLHMQDGEDWACARTADLAVIMDAAMATDEDRLYVYQQPDVAEAKPQRIGWVYFVYGNTGWDVMADNTVNLDPHLDGANALAGALCEAM